MHVTGWRYHKVPVRNNTCSLWCICLFVCSVFWDLYCAAPERRDNCEHSSEAKAFHDYVSACELSTRSANISSHPAFKQRRGQISILIGQKASLGLLHVKSGQKWSFWESGTRTAGVTGSKPDLIVDLVKLPARRCLFMVYGKSLRGQS